MKYIFIVNPIAGNKDKEKFLQRIKSTFRQLNDEMIIEHTHNQGEAKNIAEKYAKEYGKDCVIVAAGGDGTVHEVANGLAHTQTPMLVLPFGTGNDFAKKLYGTKKINVENVIKSFGFYSGKLKYDVKPIDLIDYNGEKCINVMSYGLDTLVETLGRKIAGKIPALGHQAYNIACVPILLSPLHYNINYDLNCVDKEGNEFQMVAQDKDYALFAICNASYYGGGFCPAPKSVLDDGILDYALLDGMSTLEAIPLVPQYAQGTLTDDKSKIVHTGYLTSGTIYTSDGSPLIGNCDGENFNYSKVDFKVEKRVLNMCFIKG